MRVFYPELDTAAVVRAISQGLTALEARLPLALVVLFGSYAKGTYTVASDVDLLVVHRGDPRSDAFALVKEALAVPRLEPHIYTEAEYRAMKDTIDRMVRDGIVLFPEAQARHA